MKQTNTNVIWGLLLVALGVLLLLQNLGLMRNAFSLVWSGIFTAGGIAFLLAYLSHRNSWWALIPGFFLLSLGAITGLDATFPYLARLFGGSIFLGGIGLGFIAVYLTNRANWWAIIPGGTLLTLALVAWISNSIFRFGGGSVFFLGLALTFAILLLVPTTRGRMMWPVIPATILFIFGIVTLAAMASVLTYLIPLALILIGGFLLFPVLRSQRQSN